MSFRTWLSKVYRILFGEQNMPNNSVLVMKAIDRRQFVKQSVGVATAFAAVTGLKSAPANEKILIGIMGLGGRGSFLAEAFAKRADAEIAYLCDVDTRRFAHAQATVERAQGRRPKTVQDFRRILDDPQVNVLINATPDHWHGLGTILACQAGKDVYVEKPMAHNVWEGRKMIEAARKYQRVVQVGMQSRSAGFVKEAADYLKAGKLGDVCLVRVFNLMQHLPQKPAQEQPVPEGLDYDLWCGPAPKPPYIPNRPWLNMWDYSCGAIPGDAVHQLDLARFILGDPPYPDTVVQAGGINVLRDGRDTPDTQFATYEYGKLTLLFEAGLWAPYMKKTPMEVRDTDQLPNWPFNSTRIEVLGTKGFLYLGRHGDGWQVFDADGISIIASSPPQSDKEHQDNFLDCVRTRRRPNADVEQGHYSALLCHLANISWKMGNKKLTFDGQKECFAGSPEANQYLKPSYRQPWVVPEVV
jgi:predicted dehydrogenase